jgi:hypothetical protein
MKGATKKISEQLGKSVNAVNVRASRLGIKFEYSRRPPYRKPLKYQNAEDRRAALAKSIGDRHKVKGHPMLGKHHTEESKMKMSRSGIGRKVSPETTMKQLASRYNGQGFRQSHGSWKAAWREIGGRKIFARSIWEANYARFLEFLKVRGEIREWEHEPQVFWFHKIKRGCRSYLPDFRVTQLNGCQEYHEVKGWMDKRSATKIRRFFKYYPHETLLIRDKTWFSANNPKLRCLIHDWEYTRGLPLTSKIT